MPPIHLLTILLTITAAAWAAHRLVRHFQHRALRQLAAQWHMSYAERDLFNLTTRIAPVFPLEDTDDLHVLDVIYGAEGDGHRYLFTAEFTRGPIDGYGRDYLAMTFCDPPHHEPGTCPPLATAPEGLPLAEQYRRLHDQCLGKADS